MAIDLLMNHDRQGGMTRVGDFAKDAPHIVLQCAGGIFFLPMPVNVLSKSSIEWDQKEFSPDNVMGGAMISLHDAYQNEKSPGWKGTAGAVGSGFLSQVARTSISKIGAMAGIQNAQDYVAHKDGKAVNPNKELTFSGLGYRSFSFDFELIPTDMRQTFQINSFIRNLQLHAAPEFADGGKTYFTYPKIWDVTFVPAGFMPALMQSYLTDYSINYGGSGKMVSHEGGAPVQVNINMTFTEAELHMKDKIEAGYWG